MTLTLAGTTGAALAVGEPFSPRPEDRRQRTSLTERDVVPIAASPVQAVDYAGLRRTAALEWANDVIEPLRALPAGWDSFGASILDDKAAELGIGAFVALVLLDVAPPQVFATPDGGLSFEWHRPDVDFVISLPPPDQDPPSAYFRRSDQEWEASDFLRVPDPRLDIALSAIAQD